MNSPRSIQSPRAASPKDTRPFIYLYKIEFPDNPPKRIRLPKTITEILKLSNDVLELPRPARQIFDADNNPITDIEKIGAKAKLYISCAAPPSEEDEFQYKSRLPKPAGSTFHKLPTMKPPKLKPRREDQAQQCAIAACPTTVKENLRDSILSLFASLTPEHKAKMSMAATLQKMTTDTQLYVVENALITQYIGPSTVVSNTPIGQQVQAWMIERLKGLMPEECKFAITGPSQSGKSTLLNTAVSLFYQKLQITNEAPNYLIFPINWLLQQIYLDDINKLYNLFINTALKMLRNARMEYIPIMGPFKQWMSSLITQQVQAPLPPQILHYTSFPHDAVVNIGRAIHDSWAKPEGFRQFIKEIVSFPNRIAQAFGFKSAVYVFDHFDSCGYEISPTDHFATENQSSVVLSELVCEAIDSCPFFVASQNDFDFFNVFSLQEYKQLSTERLVTIKGEKEIYVQQPPIVLNMDHCRGCPAYCATFQRVCDLAEEAASRTALKSQFTKLKSVVDISRNEMLKQEFLKLCILLGNEDTENIFNEEIMNELMELPELVIRVR
ncbi:hypothetical protein TRFO_37550 [Tritrichomonas foetus]|uniref:Uncharacterized protein n=1 Tax=Tritrichomonas foetus TaxID=1144522 RepID=A0A1J4JAS5_9EUKA|nr:hypothetical protein TRFO_37550 [Tritrichomonas foetus]|eukprot:OHS96278.1 hypothetical protein TRFO_37550 [Tritrichomonas foetus]